MLIGEAHLPGDVFPLRKLVLSIFFSFHQNLQIFNGTEELYPKDTFIAHNSEKSPNWAEIRSVPPEAYSKLIPHAHMLSSLEATKKLYYKWVLLLTDGFQYVLLESEFANQQSWFIPSVLIHPWYLEGTNLVISRYQLCDKVKFLILLRGNIHIFS